MEYLWSHLYLRKFCQCRNNTFGTIQRDSHELIRLKLDICIFWPSKIWPTPKQLAKNTKKCAINSFSKLKMIPQNWMISTSRLATIKVVGFGCPQCRLRFYSCFISKNNLLTYSVPPIQLCLFDGSSNNVITQAIKVPLRISPEHVTPFTFYITPLDSSCNVVLGYN